MPKRKIVAIIQARMSSTRLQGKVLKQIGNQPMLAWVVERAKQSNMLDTVLVATTIDPSDDPVAAFCTQKNYMFTRGSLQDVLDRYYQAACLAQAEVVVRLTADCPLLDPGVLDHTVRQFAHAGVDFAANRLPPPWHRTFPIGLDVEVCSFAALERAWQEAGQSYQREHVMPYLYEQPGRFKTLLVNHHPDYGHLRWTVDTSEDLAVVRKIVAEFDGRQDFSWKDVLAVNRRHPELEKMNINVLHKDMYASEKESSDGRTS